MVKAELIRASYLASNQFLTWCRGSKAGRGGDLRRELQRKSRCMDRLSQKSASINFLVCNVCL